ncbi:hypothetical protein THIOSC15_380002 [uncultured Thiomicrorhabdus sp.]
MASVCRFSKIFLNYFEQTIYSSIKTCTGVAVFSDTGVFAFVADTEFVIQLEQC